MARFRNINRRIWNFLSGLRTVDTQYLIDVDSGVIFSVLDINTKLMEREDTVPSVRLRLLLI